jgi:hypothetical protein
MSGLGLVEEDGDVVDGVRRGRSAGSPGRLRLQATAAAALVVALDDRADRYRFPIRDRDSKSAAGR